MAGAGKKTFTAGEVLTASDVNTFLMEQSVMYFGGTAARASAIPTPTTGMTTYIGVSGTASIPQLETYTGSAWQTPYGLTQVANVTVSGAATIQIDNCFSSAYDSYKLVISNLSGTPNGGLMNMRLGSNVTLTNYAWIKAGMSTGAATNSTGAVSQTSWGMNFISGTVPAAMFTGDIIDPFKTNYTYFNGIGYGGFTTGGVWFGQAFAGHYNATTSFTGCYFYIDSGTFSGNIKIYGYRNS